jgi:hypothetical protein
VPPSASGPFAGPRPKQPAQVALGRIERVIK